MVKRGNYGSTKGGDAKGAFIGLRLTDDLDAKLRKRARGDGVTLSRLVRRIVDAAMEAKGNE